jgi:hypothetical protein
MATGRLPIRIAAMPAGTTPLDEPQPFGDECPSSSVHAEPPVGEGSGVGVGIDQTLVGESSKQ